MPSRSLVLCLVVPCLAAACGKTNLDSRDAGRDTSVPDHHPIDGGHDRGSDAPGHERRDGATDTTPDGQPLTGRHAFDTTVKLSYAPAMPASGVPGTLPATATVTSIVDATAGWMVIGGEGQGSSAAITVSAGGGLAAGPMTLVLPFAGACDGVATFRFGGVQASIGSDGKLRGTAAGFANYVVGDVAYSQNVTAILDGVPDTTRPALPIRTAGVLDPLSPARFAASEPLPAGAKAQLVDTDGMTIELVPDLSSDGAAAFITAFRVPWVLRFGGHYHLVVNQLADFAGNQASPQGPPLVTLAASPLLTDGGFESTPAGMMGDALIFGVGDLPVISGTQSVYLNDTPGQARSLTFRLAVSPGDKAVRLAYRVTSTYQGFGEFFGTILIGSPGSNTVSVSFLPIGSPTTTVTRTGGGSLTIGPVATLELPLPETMPDTSATEVVLRISTTSSGCGLAPPSGGLIIDDVRVGS
ncbi:MAG TPA: hypothetical protein VHM31_03970 [Polyangia bacterium]|nr:hypothetical protein [Polyangia bacterium]